MTEPFTLPIAVMMDFLIGDPQRLPHPIRFLGWCIKSLELPFRRLIKSPLISGFFFSIFLISSTWLTVNLILAVAKLIHPYFKNMVEIVLIYYTISISSLQKAALQVRQALTKNDLQASRKKVGMIVGRDVKQLEAEDVARATVETVAENLVDGCLTPLFFAFLGGAPLAMAYKMVNTLDSMVGYKNERYLLFGKTAARIDDAANYIPARCAIPVIALSAQLLSKTGKRAFMYGLKEGHRHSSPNAGYPEAVFAGALSIRLGGPNYYQGRLVEKPYIGRHFGPVQLSDIKKACDLMVLSSIIWFLGLWCISLITK